MSVKTIKGNLFVLENSSGLHGLAHRIGTVFLFIASRFSKSYYTTAHQQLYGDIASTPGHLYPAFEKWQA